MTLETPVLLEATAGDAAISYDAYNLRAMFDAIWSGEGVASLTDLVVTQRGAGANMSVDVSAGLVVIQGNAIANQGKYVCRSTATVNLPIATAPGSGTRTDLIVAQLYDKQADGGTQYAWTPLVITGSTTAPPSSAVLAQVTVPTGTASITTASNINGTGRQYAQLVQTYRPVVSVQVSDAPYTTTGSFVNFTSAAFPPLNVTIPPSGMVWVSVSGSIQNTNTATSTIWLSYTATNLSSTGSGSLSTAGTRLYASRRVLWTGTPGAVATITPRWNISSGDSTTASIADGQLMAEPVP
jgi:hypothetical protein